MDGSPFEIKIGTTGPDGNSIVALYLSRTARQERFFKITLYKTILYKIGIILPHIIHLFFQGDCPATDVISRSPPQTAVETTRRLWQPARHEERARHGTRILQLT